MDLNKLYEELIKDMDQDTLELVKETTESLTSKYNKEVEFLLFNTGADHYENIQDIDWEFIGNLGIKVYTTK